MTKADNSTPPRQFRLPDDTLADLDWIAQHFALGNSRAAAIRYSARAIRRMVESAPPDKKPKKKP